MIIGRMLYCDELVNHEKLDYIEYQKIDINNIAYSESELPTLIVGWYFVTCLILITQVLMIILF